MERRKESASTGSTRSTKTTGNSARALLDDLFNQARSNCMAAGNAVRPVVFEGIFMAIVFSHEKRLTSLAKAIEELRLETMPA